MPQSDGSVGEESFFMCSTVEPNGIDIKLQVKIADKALREKFKTHYLKMEVDEKLGPTDFITFELKYK
jgi:hypothetical protein